MQNLKILCRNWKHVISAKHWIAIASKTVTGQYDSSTVLQQVNDQSDQRRKFLGLHTGLYGVVERWELGAWFQNWGALGGCLGVQKYWSLSATQTPIRQKRPNFRIPYYRPSKSAPYRVPPGAHAPFRPHPFPPPLIACIFVVPLQA